MDSGQQIETIFNNGARVIIELSQELVELRSKFGDQSKLVQKKGDQLAILITLHDNPKEYIRQLTDGLIMAEVVSHAKDVIIMQHETGLSWDKVGQLLGWSSDSARQAMSALDRVREFQIQLKELIKDDGQKEG